MSDRATATFELPAAPIGGSVRCERCAERVCTSLDEVPGVVRVDCDPSGSSVSVEFDPVRVSESEIAALLRGFGLELASSMRHAAWRIVGLD